MGMTDLKPTSSIVADRQNAVLHFSVGGMWDEASMKRFLKDLAEAASIFIDARTPFSSIGDLREFVPQNRETASAIQKSLSIASEHGMQRFAVVSSSSLVKMQYRRITEGLSVEFFETPHEAADWVREAA